MPPEHSGLTDTAVATGLDEFSAWVEALPQLWDPRHWQPLSLSLLIKKVLPQACRKILHAVALILFRGVLHRHVALYLRLRFWDLWPKVTRLDSNLTGAAGAEAAQQIKAVVVRNFLGSYYHTCQAEDRVTPNPRKIAQQFGAEGECRQLSLWRGRLRASCH